MWVGRKEKKELGGVDGRKVVRNSNKASEIEETVTRDKKLSREVNINPLTNKDKRDLRYTHDINGNPFN